MYACLVCVIVPRLTGRRRLALQPVKSQGATRDYSVVILTRDNLDVLFTFQNIQMYIQSDSCLLCFIYCKPWDSSLPMPMLYVSDQCYIIFERDYTYIIIHTLSRKIYCSCVYCIINYSTTIWTIVYNRIPYKP